MKYKIKATRYMTIIYLVVKELNTNIMSEQNIHWVVKNTSNEYISKERIKITSAKIYSADKININTLCNYKDKEVWITPEVYSLFSSMSFLVIDKEFYFGFLSNNDLINFKSFQKLTTINKFIYVNQDGFINKCLKMLESKSSIKEIPKGFNNSIPKYSKGSTGVASKIYLYKNEEGYSELLASNKISILFEDVFDSNFKYLNNFINNIWCKIKNNEVIKKSIEVVGEDIIKKYFSNEMKKKLKI